MFKLVAVILIAGVALLTAFQVTATADEEEATLVNPLIPGVASFMVPGTGQLMIGESDIALLHSLVSIGILVSGYWAVLSLQTTFPVWEITVIAELGWSAYSALDAYSSTRQLNRYQLAFRKLLNYMMLGG